MATVHVGQLVGPGGFARTVAIKRLHSHLLQDPEFVSMFLDEARVAARVQHPNVVSIIDVVEDQGELLLVMDYIPGESLHALMRATAPGRGLPAKHAVKIITDVLSGLHAAHDTTGADGLPAGIVHRDVSPQNIVVGIDGLAHLIDFGVAKAANRIQSTRDGQLKGKLAYMAPEQVQAGRCDRRSDIYAAGVVLWEMLVGQRLFRGEHGNLVYSVLYAPIQKPSALAPGLGEQFDSILLKALQRNPEHRFATALEMASALEAVETPASSLEVARWVRNAAADELDRRGRLVAEVERTSTLAAQSTDGTSAPVPAIVLVDSGSSPLHPSDPGVESRDPANPPRNAQDIPSSAVGSSRKLLIAALLVFAGAIVFWMLTRPTNGPDRPADSALAGPLDASVELSHIPSQAVPSSTPPVDIPARVPVSSSASAASTPNEVLKPHAPVKSSGSLPPARSSQPRSKSPGSEPVKHQRD
jgi:serine/threonine-protein kinase